MFMNVILLVFEFFFSKVNYYVFNFLFFFLHLVILTSCLFITM